MNNVAADDAQRDGGDENVESKMLGAARLLHRGSFKMSQGAQEIGTSRFQLVRLMRAAGECVSKHDADVFENVLAYCNMIVESKQGTAHLVHKIKYDETRMHIRCSLQGGPIHDAFAKVFCILESWNIVLSTPSRIAGQDRLVLCGGFAPKVRVGQSATGETIAELLSRALTISDIAKAKFPAWRLIETDECGANLRAEKIVSSWPGTPPKMHIICAGHKTHQVASKTWEHLKPLHAGVVKTMVFLRSPGMFGRFLQTFMRLLDSMLVITSAPLSPEAIKYRCTVLELFTPRASDSAKAHATCKELSKCLFSGDWRQLGSIVHKCAGQSCCRDRAHTLQKMKHYTPILISALKLRKLSSHNWDAWHQALNLTGFLTMMHGCFPYVFERAFGGPAQSVQQASVLQAWRSLDDVEEAVNERDALEVGDVARALQVALRFWRASGSWQDMYLLRLALGVELDIMDKLLESTSCKTELRRVMENPGAELNPLDN